ncbi:TrmB family transcriptional regulator [Mobilitalea sibirica]|uniref:TrmB family transcriptional regulator n=1 Tax=Mobilitalea sibirica TaxID=1462919 RepID=A0A8J7KWV6_9FIRM|nr:TrmB family transcriptional regulator [Mobilitalea sibirica]MBH1940962.1 TrmB family transcriptional regulator [Mobilitalea sibirica]
MNLIEGLMKTGLTKNESELYIVLCREGQLTGYEAAKISGIPRANAYQALSGLVDKGAACVVEGAVPRYVAVPVEEYCSNFLLHMKEVVELIRKECPNIHESAEGYITISGFQNILDKIRTLIGDAIERVYVSISENEIEYFKEPLEAAVAKGLKVVAIISGDFELKGVITHKINKSSGQIRLIADSSYVLTGTITGSNDDICLFSKNKPLVELLKDSLKNEIRLSEVEGSKKE